MSFSKVYSHTAPLWQENSTIPFDELILSWNGIRPNGKWTFFVSLKTSEWIPFAEWSKESQKSFNGDTVTSKELLTSFAVKVEGDELFKLHSLHVCLSHIAQYKSQIPQDLKPVLLEGVPLQSQQILNHPRAKDLCSPTATTTALSFLLKKRLDPVAFSIASHDQQLDIHGNWALNIAEAYHQSQIPCRVERLSSFHALHKRLIKGHPVIVSVKGWIPGAAKEYPQGHLLCIIGYSDGLVHCIDSAFSTNEATRVSYKLEDFLTAWAIRRNLAYTFY